MIFSILYSATVVPFQVTFYDNDEEPQFLNVIAYSIDVLFFIDIIINFFTVCTNKYDEIIVDRKKIVKSYLKGWFFFDVIATVPLDMLFN